VHANAAGCVIFNKSSDRAFATRCNGSHRHPLPEESNNTGRVAQLAEHSTLNRQVEGSIPSASTIFLKQNQRFTSTHASWGRVVLRSNTGCFRAHSGTLLAHSLIKEEGWAAPDLKCDFRSLALSRDASRRAQPHPITRLTAYAKHRVQGKDDGARGLCRDSPPF
jgi:hypothetical protein